MARQHAAILTTIWSDPDWRALSQGAQRLYLLLLSQPKLSMVGLLECLPSRWARLAADTTVADIEAALDELEASRFVLVDRDTEEVLIRTFVRHECTASKVANPRWLTGVWRAWEGIESRQLREAALAEIPPAVWTSNKVVPPAEAQNSRSAQKLLAETSGRNFQQNVPHEPRTTNQDPQQQQPGDSRAAGPLPAAAAAVGHQPGLDQQRLEVFQQAIELLTDRELLRNPSRHNPKRHRDAVRKGKSRDHATRAHAWLREHPDGTAEQLADHLEPPDPALAATPAGHRPANGHQGNTGKPDPTPVHLPATNGHSDPLAGVQAAARARAERHLRVIHGQACPDCHDTGWRLDPDSNAAVPCHHQTAQEAR